MNATVRAYKSQEAIERILHLCMRPLKRDSCYTVAAFLLTFFFMCC